MGGGEGIATLGELFVFVDGSSGPFIINMIVRRWYMNIGRNM